MAIRFHPAFRKFRIILLSTVGVLMLAFIIFVIVVLDSMPRLEELENPNTSLATMVYSADGKVIGTFYRHENRVFAKMSEIPPVVKNALIATEDKRFYHHSGIDLWGLFRAFGKIATGDAQGGSTLTMQLARNLYDEQQVGKARNATRKLKEMIVSVYLERRYTKDEIILHYLNTVPFGGTLYGIQSAANVYFGKNCAELSLHEAALLVGMLKGPSVYNPLKNPKKALNRRNIVLELMANQGIITPAQADSAKQLPLGVRTYGRLAHNRGVAPYFREHLRLWLQDWCDKCEVTINHNGKRRCPNIYTDGLRVYTTLDTRMQVLAEQSMQENMRLQQERFNKNMKGYEIWKKDTTIIRRAMRQSARYNTMLTAGHTKAQIEAAFREKVPMQLYAYNDKGYIEVTMSPLDSIYYYKQFLESGMVAINPENGHIKVWIGGLDQEFFKYDHVAKTKRQVGSTFKPFVYTAAFDNGYTPCTQVSGERLEWTDPHTGKVWDPKNADGKYPGKMPLRRALALSVNTVTARLITEKVTPHEVVRYAQKMGIRSEIQAVPSLALGSFELNILELTSAYATIAGRGVWHEPIFVTRIEDKFGNVIKTFVPNTTEALSEETAYLMVQALRAVVDQGTAGNLRPEYKVPWEVEVAGKTGTTNKNTDAWFMCITPDLAIGTWVGNADQAIHYPEYSVYGQGGYMAMPNIAIFLRRLYTDPMLKLEKRGFPAPKNMTSSCVETAERTTGNYNRNDAERPSNQFED
ncbi:MAG: transglycosylase domain-containing protein [Bacteroidetes bacterium]|nr:transglycosylase domain-containing protein [Bacteroidota bacterium]